MRSPELKANVFATISRSQVITSPFLKGCGSFLKGALPIAVLEAISYHSPSTDSCGTNVRVAPFPLRKVRIGIFRQQANDDVLRRTSIFINSHPPLVFGFGS
eukprot:GILI01028022.1.p2 GENE.GILI01028022.1~~GILI01028022.1.p2  ORF type:complete len:102 (-),score=5.05 GILI01028022.1:78-383(-)